MNAHTVKANIAREYPIEEQLSLFMDKCVWNCKSPVELPRRLRMGRFMADKAMRILVEEMDVRGSQAALKAMEEVEQTLTSISEVLNTLEKQ